MPRPWQTVDGTATFVLLAIRGKDDIGPGDAREGEETV